jgi:peptidoglycan hydrolase CwlO-like protein
VPVAVLFDTLEYVHKLTRAGVPAQQAEAQAEALAGALGTAVATRDDLRAVEANVEAKLDKLDARVDKLEAKIDKLDARVDKLVGSVDMLKWLFGFLAATNVAMLVRLATQ